MRKMQKKMVLIFYSSESEPEIPSVYNEGLSYLNELDIEHKLIDVYKNPKIAEKYNVMATPVLFIITGNKTTKYIGVIDGFKNLITLTLSGKSILHLMGFKEGRNIGENIHFRNKDQLENDLELKLINKGISAFKVIVFDRKNNSVTLRLISDAVKNSRDSKLPICNDISSFFGGIFTEIFGKGVHFKENQCIAQGNSYCEFETVKEDIKARKKSGTK